jgi:CDP-glycerol glycerophosphotransferase
MEVYCASECIGIYPDVKYRWRVRYGYKKSITQSVSETKNLKDRLTIIYKILDLLNSQSKYQELLDIFYLKLAEIDILQFINQFGSCNDEYEKIMYEEVKPFVLTFPSDVFEKLNGIDRSKYVLFLEDNWDELILLIQSHKNLNNDIKTLKAKNRNLSKLVHQKNKQLKEQKKIIKIVDENERLNNENESLREEIKVIKSTSGWFKYKTNNIYLRLLKKI